MYMIRGSIAACSPPRCRPHVRWLRCRRTPRPSRCRIAARSQSIRRQRYRDQLHGTTPTSDTDTHPDTDTDTDTDTDANRRRHLVLRIQRHARDPRDARRVPRRGSTHPRTAAFASGDIDVYVITVPTNAPAGAYYRFAGAEYGDQPSSRIAAVSASPCDLSAGMGVGGSVDGEHGHDLREDRPERRLLPGSCAGWHLLPQCDELDVCDVRQFLQHVFRLRQGTINVRFALWIRPRFGGVLVLGASLLRSASRRRRVRETTW